MKNIWIALLFFLLFFLGWETYSRLHADMAFALPAPSAIARCLWQRGDRLGFHSLVTLKEMAGGLLLATSLAFPLAWTMYRWQLLRTVLQPAFILIQCLPMFALAPLMVLWFGWSYTAIVIPTALMIFYPLTMNLYKGFCATPQDLLDYFRLHEATAWQTFAKLQLPWAAPHIAAGGRISAAIAGMGAVAGEWAGGQSGLGVLMLESRRGVDLELTFAALFCLTAISLLFYGAILLLESSIVKRGRALLSIALLFCTFSCQQSSPNTKLLLDWFPNPNHVPLYAGIEQGFFHQEGIDLQLLKIHDPSESLSFLATGTADLALYYMPETYVAKKQGAHILIAGYLVRIPLNGFIYRTGENIHDPADLTGKRLGYSVGDFGLELLKNMLRQNHIVPSEIYNVSFDPVGPFATKRIDVLYGAYWNIETEHLRSLGIETDYFRLEELGYPPHEELLILAKDTMPAPFVARFKKALQASIDYSVKHPEEAFAAYKRGNPDKGANTLEWELRAWKRTAPILAQHQEDDPTLWNTFINWVEEK